MADSADKDQKTEEATPRRRSESRTDGNVAMSSEFIAAVSLCIGLACLATAGRGLMDAVGAGTASSIAALPTLGTMELSVPMAGRIISQALTQALGPLALVTLPAIGISLLVGYLQVGFAITPKALEIKWSKLDLIKGAQRFVSMRSWVRTGMAALKMILITGTVIAILMTQIDGIIRVSDGELGPILASVGHVLVRCILGALAVILALSVIDMIYQRYQHEKDLRMSKQEIKDEQKQTDGDPQLKARIRRTQQEISTRRMMDDVPKATVVVTNPTHYAVALRYEQANGEGAQSAPIVVAKGVDSLAQRIKAVAKDHDILCYEDVPLARALHARAELGQEIPEDLYAAVAAVLGYVYRMQGKTTAMSVGA